MPATIVNLTPLPLRICDEVGNILRVIEPAPEGPALILDRTVQTGTIDDVPILVHKLSRAIGLPVPKKDHYYVVSEAVADGAAGYPGNLLVPGPVVKDGNGIPIGCYGLVSP
jgi:hypothetical protein